MDSSVSAFTHRSSTILIRTLLSTCSSPAFEWACFVPQVQPRSNDNFTADTPSTGLTISGIVPPLEEARQAVKSHLSALLSVGSENPYR